MSSSFSSSISSFGASAGDPAIRADGVSQSYRARRILSDVSLVVPPGARVGLIGENGAGKSTLLRLLAGVEPADSGVIARPERTGLLWQEPPFERQAVFSDVIEDALAEVRAMESELEAAAADLAEAASVGRDEGAAVRRYDAALDEATRADVWSAPARADAAIEALGLGGIDRTTNVSGLSGGQLARLSFAWLLIRRPTALLLDEPTNHLDDAATAFVLGVIRDWPGPVLFSSHDRAFLDEAATGIVDLDPTPHEGDGVGAAEQAGPLLGDGVDQRAADVDDDAGFEAAATGRGITAFGGSFSDYLVERERRHERWRVQYRDEQDELARLTALAERAQGFGRVSAARAETRIARKFFGDRNARVVSERVRSAGRQTDALARVAIGPPPTPLRFTPPGSGAQRWRRDGEVPGDESTVGDRGQGLGTSSERGALITLDHAGIAGRLAPVSLAIEPGDGVLVTGPNGAGKSTLLHLLAGRLSATSGTVEIDSRMRVGLLQQDVTFERPARRASEVYRDAVGVETAEVVPLATFGLLTVAEAARPVAELSVGQRRRVALAIVLADPPDLLLLDEPTNHLSLALATELEDALAQYDGAVVVASHDRWLRRRWARRRLELVPS